MIVSTIYVLFAISENSNTWLPFLLKLNIRNISQKIYKKNMYK